jgi:hypothetical protein
MESISRPLLYPILELAIILYFVAGKTGQCQIFDNDIFGDRFQHNQRVVYGSFSNRLELLGLLFPGPRAPFT